MVKRVPNSTKARIKKNKASFTCENVISGGFDQHTENIHQLFIMNLILIGFIIIVTICISMIYQPKVEGVELLIPEVQDGVYFKPFEKFAFMLSALLVPIFSVSYIYIFKINKPIIRHNIAKFIPILIAVLFFSPLVFEKQGSETFFNVLLQGIAVLKEDTLTLLFFCWITAFIFTYIECCKKDIVLHNYQTYLRKLIFFLIVFASIFILSSWRIYSINAITFNSRYYVHLDAVLYALAQVVAGKTLLVDLPAQYGLFSEFLLPVFKVIQLNVLNFTLLMAFFQIVSLFILFWVLNRIITNSKIFALCCITIIILTFDNFTYLGRQAIDQYFQYWPIRFLWPAISVGIFYICQCRKSLVYSSLFSIVATVATLWNFDSGAIIFLSYIIYLLMKIILLYNVNKLKYAANYIRILKYYVQAVILHLIIGVVVCLLFFSILKIHAKHDLNFSWLFIYQMIFYKLGFFMMPIPKTLHPWMSVIGIYIYGIVQSIVGFKKSSSVKNDLLFYLSVLGVGLFSYYEGRSHVYNLFKVLWPALIVALILIDSTVHSLKLKLIHPINMILPTAFIAFMLLCNLIFVYNIPYVYSNLVYQFETRNTVENPIVTSELKFIGENYESNGNCLILTQLQGVYSTELHLASPLNGPGLVEIVLQSDLDNFIAQIQNTPPKCIFIGNHVALFNLGIDYNQLLAKYIPVASNPEQTITLLKLR